jgi:putative heme iron utilization protein
MASGTAEQGDEGARRGAPDFDALALGKALLRSVGSGALATLDTQGAPYSSLTSVATDVDGRPLLLLSRLAAHTGHLETDARASLLFARIGRGDPLAHPRLTLIGRASRLERGSVEHHRARRRFLAAHPKAALYAGFADFSFWRLDPSQAHLNGGFARAAQLSGTELLTEVGNAQELVSAEENALAHMNQDHAEAIALYATALLGAAPGPWKLTGLDPEGCDLAQGDERRRLAFPRPVHTPEQLRAMLVDLAREARAKGGGPPEERA